MIGFFLALYILGAAQTYFFLESIRADDDWYESLKWGAVAFWPATAVYTLFLRATE